jgi:integrase
MELRPAEDGGTFKNEGSERTVPLHPAVIEAGFLDFVREKGLGPLFYGRSRRRDASRHASKGTANHLAEWIREQGFTNPRQAPNHALRHWFKSAASRAGIQDSMADALQGHLDASSAGTYRHIHLDLRRVVN